MGKALTCELSCSSDSFFFLSFSPGSARPGVMVCTSLPDISMLPHIFLPTISISNCSKVIDKSSDFEAS